MKRSLLLAPLLIAALSTTAFASGFAIIEQSVSGLGSAFSGGAAAAEDASAMFFNPAIMTQIKGQQVVGGSHVIVPSAKVTISEATSPGVAINPAYATITGGNGEDAGVVGVVPNLYYVNNPGNGFAFGLGINAPFGLATKYDKTWIGRYHAVESDVMTININPALAYQVNDQLSLGAGLNVMYMKATLSSMANGGLALFQATSGALGTPNDPSQDVFIENEADSWSYGYNLGATYQLTDATRFGLAYRSEVKQKLEGTTKTDVPVALAAISSLFQNQGVNGKIDLPASASLSVNHQLNQKLSIMGDVSWTQWSNFQELTLNFEGAGIGLKPSTTTVEKWDDSWRFALGSLYQYSDELTLRCGVAFDQTPIASAEHRTPRIPGEDRTWLSVGAGYKFSDSLRADFAYAHLFVKDSELNLSLADNTSAGSLVGKSENKVDIVSVQLVYAF